MTIPRAVSVTLAVVAVALLATSTLGYSSASMDRGVQVDVVDAEDAYVNATACEKPQGNNSENGANPVRVTVTNQHTDSFTVESITWSDDAHPTKTELEPGDEVGPGETVTYNNAFGTDQVTIEVSGNFHATVTVDVEQCDHPNNAGNASNGSGSNANGSANGTNGLTAPLTDPANGN